METVAVERSSGISVADSHLGMALTTVKRHGVRAGEAQFRSYAQKQTVYGMLLVDFWMKVLQDETLRIQWRLAAAEQLADRAFGRPIRQAKITLDTSHTETQIRLDALSAEKLAELESMLTAITVDVIEEPSP
jgi:hypothetical protein